MAKFIAVIEIVPSPEQATLMSRTLNTDQIESWYFTEAKHEKALGVDEGCEASSYIAVKMTSGKLHLLRHTEKQLIEALICPNVHYTIEG